jgi:uncharacterized protein (TIGR00730 family)
MRKRDLKKNPYPSAKEVAEAQKILADAQHIPPSLRLSFTDMDFLVSEEMRPVRLMLELMKPESILQKNNIDQTIVIFGSARISDQEVAEKKLRIAENDLRRDPENAIKQQAVQSALSLMRKSHYYDEARKLGHLIGKHFKQQDVPARFYVATGGGPGIMEAANRGASEAGAENIGFTIAIPRELPNVYSSHELTFQFHYFAIRKMHLLLRARALIVFPGGYGTLDELFETLTLMQTYRLQPIPVLLFGRSFWEKIINFNALLDEGVISPNDLNRFKYVDSAEEAWEKIVEEYSL